MKTAVYPGSFDPITNGHLDVVERAQSFFDKLYILVAHSFDKTPLFTTKERIKLIEESTAKYTGKIEIVSWTGLTVDFLKKNNVDCIVRGVRSSVDFRAEQTLANVNYELYPDCETLLLCSRPSFRDVSSRLVKEIAHHGGGIEKFVPSNVSKALKLKFDK
jgi:pantetheine-phosphate adenylyltransferase